MGFGPGYLDRLWPFTVRQHILTLKSYQEFPEKFFAETEIQSSNSLKDADHIKFFRDYIQAPFLKKQQFLSQLMEAIGLNFQRFLQLGLIVDGTIYFGDQFLKSLKL